MTSGMVEADFCAVFGADATLAGVAVSAVVDQSAEIVDNGVLVSAPTAQLLATAAPSAAAGQVFVAAGSTYTVRQVRQLPPDGALLQLVLARTA